MVSYVQYLSHEKAIVKNDIETAFEWNTKRTNETGKKVPKIAFYLFTLLFRLFIFYMRIYYLFLLIRKRSAH